jgi:hypothetical protein
MSRTSASFAERKAPPFTFYDPEREGYRPQFTSNAGSRSHPYLRRPDRSLVKDVADVTPAMAKYCRKLVNAGFLDPKSEVAVLYLGEGAQIIQMPMPPRAPAPLAQTRAKSVRAPLPSWHGMDILSIEVDYKLIASLTPDGSAVRVGVAPKSPASKARLRTGDYVLSIGQDKLISLPELDALRLPVGAELLVKFYRPGAKGHDWCTLKLRRSPGAGKPPPWRTKARVAFGPRVERDERKEFLSEMARHPHLTDGCVRLLVRFLNYHQGPLGICPRYKTMAANSGRVRRTIMRYIDRMEWCGIVEPLIGKGLMTAKGPTNQYIIHWPDGWIRERSEKQRGDTRVTS